MQSAVSAVEVGKPAAAGTYLARRVGMLLVRGLPQLLDRPMVYRPLAPLRRDVHALIGWGLKGKFREDADFAARNGLPYLAVEDGFLRSISLGDTDAALSLSFDDLGVYYDASAPSRLEQYISAPHSGTQQQRAASLAIAWRAERLSKYNHAREANVTTDQPYVLAIDQTFGDMSIALGQASPASFARMLEAALDEHPSLPVLLKVHPDVIAGRKRAHFSALSAGAATRVRLIATNIHPPSLLERTEAVYVVTSQMGFEALMWGKKVRTFGMPFYGGWGLTEDEIPAPERRREAHAVTLNDLVHAALIEYPRYIDPETFERCEVERLMDWMALQRRMRERFTPQVQMVAFSNWKKPIARAFFAGSQLDFVATPVTSDEMRRVPPERACWGRSGKGSLLATAQDAPNLCVEDGFLRSVGLGADWITPLSWVIDRAGIYYDATAPSDLENLLQTAEFDESLLARAAALRERIVAAGVTKYNVGSGVWSRPAGARRVVLVPGQVETDASIAYGASGLRSNLALLQAVRHANPDAYVIYKPHPDVVAKKRLRGRDEDQARLYCDEIVTEVPIHRLLDAVDEVHVLTSLAGFEALMRGRRVVCHGHPFYAGWGLTDDQHPHPRRTRRRTVDELVAAALILYPTYVSRVSGAFTTAERALHELQHWQELETPREAVWLRAARALKRFRDRWRQRR